MENDILNQNQIKTDIKFLDEYYCDKNIDRTKFFKQSKKLIDIL